MKERKKMILIAAEFEIFFISHASFNVVRSTRRKTRSDERVSPRSQISRAYIGAYTYRRASPGVRVDVDFFFPDGKVNKRVERMTNGNYRVPVRDR